ncbi:ferritin [Cellulosimicrobium cellulans]|uniref:ferritin n=1 Tax=Cellulosimicrobium cellulans TaxID=1710 RepID=UPI0037F1F9E8
MRPGRRVRESRAGRSRVVQPPHARAHSRGPGRPRDAARASVVEPLRLALDQEKQVTAQIEAIVRAAREKGDALGEQLLLWFLKEQVEEVASATTLLTVAQRAGDNLFDLENFVARETIGDAGESADAPEAAGGAL